MRWKGGSLPGDIEPGIRYGEMIVDVKRIQETLQATVIEGNDQLDSRFEYIYASDLMSDVLAFGKSNSILLTGLATRQAVISAHMAEFQGVIFIRGKKPKDDSGKVARDYKMFLLTTELDMYEACVRIGSVMNNDSQVVKSIAEKQTANVLSLKHVFYIEGNDYANAGMISTKVKSILKKIGFNPDLVRRVAISTYEGEMNVVMHARRARVHLSVSPRLIEVEIDDDGKGIPNVDQAMEEGFTTATEEMRAMGFGSGMGLPNIKKNSDKLDIKSEVGKGTRVRMQFFV
jgi:anti-sigma regulatory factor (Ser/Thr protein kinase)